LRQGREITPRGGETWTIDIRIENSPLNSFSLKAPS
jgi:hypothetical protein